MKVTAFGVIQEPPAPVGAIVTANKKDASVNGMSIVEINYNGKKIAAVSMANGAKGSGVSILLPDTEALTPDMIAKMPDTWQAKVVGHGKINHGMPKDAMVLEFTAPWEKTTKGRAAQQGDTVLSFKIQGANSLNPGKAKVIASLNQGDDVFLDMVVEAKKDAEQIFMVLNNEKAGFIAANAASEEDYNLLMTILKDGAKLEGKAFGQTAASYQVKVLISAQVASAAAATAAKAVNAAEKKRIVSEGIASEDVLAQIEDYCLDCGMTPKQVGNIFATYKMYPAEAQAYMIAQPKTLYKDVHGYMEEAVCSVLAHEPVVFSGEAGSGKNCAVETLAWIFQRPLLDVSINAQTDKYDLMGSKTIDVEETDSGVPIQKVTFQVEHLGRAMEWGAFFNTDELNFADQGVTGIMHAVADTRRALDIPGYRKIVADVNFQLIATMNVDYAGTHELNAALDSRYDEIVFEMPESIMDILERTCPFASKRDMQTCDKIYKKVLAANADNTMCMQISARNFIKALNKVNQGLSLRRALRMNLTNKLRDGDYKKAMDELIEMNCPK